jgi:isoaspartyl peptidase/L-asparaginase-like protein (Ntn-hydrolase superfamily)
MDPSVVLLEEFSTILAYGKKKKDEDLANRMLLYIFFCCDLTDDNFMRDIDFRQKPEQALMRAFAGKKDKFTSDEQDLIDAGIAAYNFFNETSAERAVLAIDKKIDEARTVLETTEIEIVRNQKDNGEVSFASNETILSKLATNIGALMTLKLSVMNAAKKMENTGRVRGGKGSSLLERGGLIQRPEDE